MTLPTLSKKRGPVPGNACKITEDPQRQRGGGLGWVRLGLNKTIFIRKESDSNTRIETFRANPQVSVFQAPPGVGLGISQGGPGRLSDREDTALRGVRAAMGPRKHVTPGGPGRSRAEKTRHSEGSGTQSGRRNTVRRGARVAVGPRKRGIPSGPGRNLAEKTRRPEGSGRNRTDKTRHLGGPVPQSDR